MSLQIQETGNFVITDTRDRGNFVITGTGDRGILFYFIFLSQTPATERILSLQRQETDRFIFITDTRNR